MAVVNSGDRGCVRRVIVTVELAGYTKLFQSKEDLAVADFVSDYYELCERTLSAKGGTILKFMGDGCLATFPESMVTEAVAAAMQLERGIDGLGPHHGVRVTMGANIHLAMVVESMFGSGPSRRLDVIGRGVNQTFLLGRGPGIRISEPVYRQLPNEARELWNKHKPPAIYHLTAAAGVLEGQGQDAGTSTAVLG
jgi:class 3 adenylate cyclase